MVRTRPLSRYRRPPARSDTFLAVCGRKASAQENCLRLAHPKDHPVPGPVQTSPPRGSRSFVLIRIEDRVIARFVMCFCSGVSLPFADSPLLLTFRERCLHLGNLSTEAEKYSEAPEFTNATDGAMTRSSSHLGKTFREALGGGVRTRLRTGWSLGWVRRRKSSCRPGTGRKCKKSSGANRRAASARERSRSDTSPQGATTIATSTRALRPTSVLLPPLAFPTKFMLSYRIPNVK